MAHSRRSGGGAPAEAVRQWANLGYPRRALWLHRAAVEIRDRHAGIVPEDVDALLALSGIGDYTARAVAVFAYGSGIRSSTRTRGGCLARAVDGRSQPGRPRRDLAAMDGGAAGARRGRRDRERRHHGAGRHRLHGARPAVRGLSACGSVRMARGRLPDTGDERRRQARYEGSDRQARGAVMKTLRDAAPLPSRIDEVLSDWPDARQRDRAIDSLIADGLAEGLDGMLQLPR